MLNFCDEATQLDKWHISNFLFALYLSDILVKDPLKGPGFCDDVKDSKSKCLKSLASEDIADSLLG